MLLFQITTRNTGNSVADYTESYYKCDACNGNGQIIVDKSELIDKMEGLTFSQAMTMYRQWKTYGGKCDCPACDGMGEYIDRN